MAIHRILIVDDDSLSREFLTEAVRTLGYHAESVTSGEQALERTKSQALDLVLTDLRMPGLSGVDLVKRLQREHPELPVVLVTAHGTIETAVEAMKHGAKDFLIKPCSPNTIALVIKRIENTLRMERENEYLRAEAAPQSGQALIAESSKMAELLRSAERIASSKGTVLVTGESGTGKERIAHFIHHKSPRRNGPFIRVNCAALPEPLLESELFGHERGAFTGAHKRREGRFELAHGGSILLDEIGEISPALQAKLLRVLEEEEFERVGGSTTLKVDVRVIATTNRDLKKEVAAGSFREDLFYRLHVLPIHVPALRERPQDVMLLARHFAEHYAKQHGRPTPSFAPDAEGRLREWRWPGNVRELENAIQRAIVLLDGDRIEPRHMAFESTFAAQSKGPEFTLLTGKGSYIGVVSSSNPLANRQIADIEREAILSTLEATRGNKTEAARRLGVTSRTLSNKMRLWRQLGLVA